MIEQQVPDADYYIFDDDRTEEHVKQDQVSIIPLHATQKKVTPLLL
jgi:hypothetical protein